MNLTKKMFQNEIGKRFIIDQELGIYKVIGTVEDLNDLGVIFKDCSIYVIKGNNFTNYQLKGIIFKTYENLQYIPVESLWNSNEIY